MLNPNVKRKVKPFLYFIGILRHFWFSTLAVLLVLIVRGAYTVLAPQSISRIIGMVSSGSYSIWPTVLQYIVITLLLYLAYRLLLYAYFIRDEVQMHAKIITDGLERVLVKNQNYFTKYSPGLLLSKVLDLHVAVRELHMSLQYWLLPSAFVAVIVSIQLFSILPILSLLTLQPLIATCIALALVWKRLQTREKEYIYFDSRIRDKLNDVLSNSLCIRLFTGLKYQMSAQKDSFHKLRKVNAKLNWIYLILFTVYDISIISLIVAQFYILLKRLQMGRISTETFSAVMIQTSLLQSTLWQIVIGIPELFLNYSKLKEAMLVVWDGEEERGGKELIISTGEIVYDKVSFGYGGASLFQNLSVRIGAGEMIGLVGKSGAGKTSFVNLLLGLHTQDSGSIKIDQQDLSEVAIKSLRQHIGIIPQQPLLFNDSIYNNILYGKFSASEEEIINAAKIADLHDFILTLPDGYQTSATDLSGGQKQRISIARAILRNPAILILDEATSQLDSVTEKSIQDAIEQIRPGRTIIVIAHRLSTLTACDRIFVLKEGEIVENGTHEELMQLNKEYATLYKTQYAIEQSESAT